MTQGAFPAEDYKLTEYQLEKKYPNAERKSAWRQKLLDAAKDRGSPPILGEGDSWFDFPFPLHDPDNSDILDVLLSKHKYAVARDSLRGDTLANMCREQNVGKVVALCREHHARAFLFSGGGNDLVDGDPRTNSQLYLLLNDREEGRQPIKDDELEEFVRYLQNLIVRMLEGVSTLGIKTLMAGYGYAIPSGTAAFCKPFGKCIGPWLRPSLEARGYFDTTEQRNIVNAIMDKFNGMLKQLAHSRSDFVYLDLRPVIEDDDWRDELHLTPQGFNKAADTFHSALQTVLQDLQLPAR